MTKCSMARSAAGHAAVLVVLAGVIVAVPVFAADGSADLARGDALYARGQLAEAHAAYLSAASAAPGHFGTLCRLARVESELGEDAKGDAQRQLMASAVGSRPSS